jgi:hypothetical protein
MIRRGIVIPEYQEVMESIETSSPEETAPEESISEETVPEETVSDAPVSQEEDGAGAR